MPSLSVSVTPEEYELLKKMEHDWILQGTSATVRRFIKLGWAHWSGCLNDVTAEDANALEGKSE